MRMLSQDWVKLQPQIYICFCIFIHHGTSAKRWLRWCVVHFPWSRSYFGVMSHSWVYGLVCTCRLINGSVCSCSYDPSFMTILYIYIDTYIYFKKNIPLLVSSVRHKVTSAEFYMSFHLWHDLFFPSLPVLFLNEIFRSSSCPDCLF